MRLKRKLMISIICLLGGALTLTGCSSAVEPAQGNPGSHDTVRIGGNWELSGPTAGFGAKTNKAIEMAIDEQNAAGGLLGKPVEYIVYDNRSTTEDTVMNASRLVSVDDVSVVLGTGSTNTALAQVPTLEAGGVPLVGASLTGDNLTVDESGHVRKGVFRVCFQDSFQGKVLADFSDKKGYKRAIIIKDNSTDYGQQLASQFKKNFDGEVIDEEGYVSKEQDFSALLTNVKQLNPDVIFIAGYYEEGGTIIQQARQLGIETPILGPDGFGNQELIDLAGKKNTDKVFYVSHFVPNETASPEAQKFMKNYQKKYHEEPDQFAALGYDTARFAMSAIERAKSDKPADMIKAMEQTRNFPGVTGTFSIDKNHNTIKPAYVVELSQGKIIGSTQINP